MRLASHGRLLALGAVMAAVVVACGGEPDQPPAAPATTPPPTATSPATPTAPPEAAVTPSPPATPTPVASPTPAAQATPTPTPSPTASEPEPTALRYDTYDLTGAVEAPGSYAFLADADDSASVVTTYEGLRDGSATTLLIHTTDADGVSRADVYDAVEVGDLFEWRQADDCWVHYVVEEVKPDPDGATPRKLLAVRWVTLAYTGCTGNISTSSGRTITWSPPNPTRPADGHMAAPIRHGPWLLLPLGWTGEVEEIGYLGQQDAVPRSAAFHTTDIEEARRHVPLWREPEGSPGSWTLFAVYAGVEAGPWNGYHAVWQSAKGQVDVVVAHSRWRVDYVRGVGIGSVWEMRRISGHPALVKYSPTDTASTRISLYDEETGLEYFVATYSFTVDEAIRVALSLVGESVDDATPPATALRYDTYDLSGAVATPGSYAFLADADDPSSVVATYEGLRDGAATTLLIHTTDADGVSRADVYDAVEVGDVFEWRQADDCWVRYLVEEVKPDPDGATPRKLLAVRWVTYAYTGCTGSLSVSGERSITWSAPDIRFANPSTVVTSPTRHGPWLLSRANATRMHEQWDIPTRLAGT